MAIIKKYITDISGSFGGLQENEPVDDFSIDVTWLALIYEEKEECDASCSCSSSSASSSSNSSDSSSGFDSSSSNGNDSSNDNDSSDGGNDSGGSCTLQELCDKVKELETKIKTLTKIINDCCPSEPPSDGDSSDDSSSDGDSDNCPEGSFWNGNCCQSLSPPDSPCNGEWYFACGIGWVCHNENDSGSRPAT